MISEGNRCVSFSIPFDKEIILEESIGQNLSNKDLSDLVGTAIKKYLDSITSSRFEVKLILELISIFLRYG